MKSVLIFLLLIIGVTLTFFNSKIIQKQGGYKDREGEYPIKSRKISMLLFGIAALIAAIILLIV